MSINDTRFDEDDTFTAARLNDRFALFAGAGAGVNGITAADIQRNSLLEVPSLIPRSTLNPSPPRISVDPAGEHTYINVHPAWTVVTDGATPAQMTWTNTDLGMAGAQRIAAILVLANVEVRRIYTTDSPAVGGQTAAFALQYLSTAGTWTTLMHTERFMEMILTYAATNAYRTLWKDVPIRTLLTTTEAAAMRGVRIVTAVNSFGAVTAPEHALWRYNLSVIPLHSADP